MADRIIIESLQFPLYFKGEREGMLVIPRDLTVEDYAILKQQIESAFWVIESVPFIVPDVVETEPIPERECLQPTAL